MTSIVVGKDRISLLESERYVAGTKKLYTIKVAFSDDWEGLEKRVLFKTDKFEMSVAVLGCAETFPIPWEIFAQPSNKLQVGAYGCRCDQKVLNTRFASLGRIWKGSVDPCGCGCGPNIPSIPSPGSFCELAEMISHKADRLTFEDNMFILWAGDDPLSSFEMPIDSDQLIPPGGETGQVLAKVSNADGDVYWKTVKGSEPSAALKVPLGTIQMWHGSIDDIPESYSLCDGQNGTPDLRKAMIVGASESLEPGTEASGSLEDTPMPISRGRPLPEKDGIRYYALAFIQKTSLTEADQKEGKTAYELAVDNGFEGTEEEWLASLEGPSAYEIAVQQGFKGTEAEWVSSLRGMPGTDGRDGKDGKDGVDGKDGSPGEPGKSAYEIAVDNGFTGTEEEWLNSLGGSSGSDIPPVVDKEIESKDDLFLDGTGSYHFDNVSIISPNKTIMFENDTVYVDATNPEKVTITTLDNSKYVITANSAGYITGIEEIEIPETPISNDEIDALKPGSGAGGATGDEGTGIEKDGKSAYEIAVEHGFTGTEEEWLESLKGQPGENGKSAYEIALDKGFTGSETDWLESLNGEPGIDGKSAYDLAKESGFTGTKADWLESLNGEPGIDGKSAYDLAKESGFTGTEAEWLASLKGDPGIPGDDGLSAYQVAVSNGYSGAEAEWLQSLKGQNGSDGKSAYEIAVENGYEGTESEWLNTFTKGSDGDSAYEVAVKNGFAGTEPEWLDSLKGATGDTGADGKSAYDVAKANGFEGTESEWLSSLKGESVQAIPDYSTGELIAGRWIDDRPIYRVVVRTNVSMTDGETVVANIANVEPITIHGTLKRTGEDTIYILPGTYLGFSYGFSYSSTSGAITLWSNTSSSVEGALVLVAEYVKIGDSTLTDDQLVVDPGATKDHRQLEHRDASAQHPIAAIDGLTDRLNVVPNKPITNEEIGSLFN